MRWIAIVLIVLTSTAYAADAPATAPAAAPAAPIEAIRVAATPSAAVEAYARAVAAAGVTDELQRAFIRRTIDLGVPELAEAQAQDLIRRGVPDGLSLGVVAYVAAARGEMSTAIEQLKLALMSAPDDFLLRTAGQVLAWYDTLEDRSALTTADKQALDWIRTHAKDKPAFADAYRIAASTPRTMTTAQAEVVEPAQQPRIYIARYEPSYDPYPRRTYVYSYPIHTNPFFCKPHLGGLHHHRPTVGPLPHWDRHDGFHRSPGRGGFVIGGGRPQHREPDVVTTLRGNAEPSIRVAPMRPSVTSPRHDVTPDQTSAFGAGGHRAGGPPARSSPPPGRFGVNRDGGSSHNRDGNVTSTLGGRR